MLHRVYCYFTFSSFSLCSHNLKLFSYNCILVLCTVCLWITEGICSWKCVHIVKFNNPNYIFALTLMFGDTFVQEFFQSTVIITKYILPIWNNSRYQFDALILILLGLECDGLIPDVWNNCTVLYNWK